MEKRVAVRYLILILIFVGLIGSLIILRHPNLLGFAVFQQENETDFNPGTYDNTTYADGAVLLSGDNLTGEYTSIVFDAGNIASWNNLSWGGNEPGVNEIYVVDGQADVWKSIDAGISWVLVKDDYNEGAGNDANDMGSDDSNLYIIHGRDIWRSSDYGVVWSKINDEFNPESGTNGFFIISAGSSLFAVDGGEDAWKSVDYGENWIQTADNLNEDNGNIFGFCADSLGNLYAVDGQADVWKSTDEGATWTIITDDYNGGETNSPSGLMIDISDYFYVVEADDDVWKSTDNGETWSKVNDDYNTGEGQHAQVVIYFNQMYIIEGDEDVWASDDGGVNWDKKSSDFNGDNGNAKGISSLVRYTDIAFQVRNCSQADCSDASFVSIDLDSMDINGRYFQYKVFFSSPDTSISPELHNVVIDYTILNTPPSITLTNPQDEAAYGYNESLSLNFSVSDDNENIDSCWYSIDEGDSIMIPECQNTTFSISEGSHILSVYVNDTNGAESQDNSSFSVQVGAPTIELHSPIGAYLNSHSVVFTYTPTDVDLDSCELWGNLTGSFALNQTDVSPASGSENTFSLDLPDGVYVWNIKCNDSLGHFAVNGNKTFYVDTSPPVISLTQPTGTKTSRTPTATWSVSDSSPVSCLYNVYRGGSVEIENSSINCSANSKTFNVTVDANFVFNFYASDSAGNKNSAASEFSVDTSISPPPSEGGELVVGGGIASTLPKLNINEIPNLILGSGESKKIVLKIKNAGFSFLNNCKVKGRGDYLSWISSEETKGLSAGEESEFVFTLVMPSKAESELYDVEAEVECKELTKPFSFVVEILVKKLDINLINLEKGRDFIEIAYSLTELYGIDQEVEVEILLFDSSNERVAEATETKFIKAGSNNEFSAVLPIADIPEGNFNLLINANSNISSGFLQEEIILGSSRVGGFAIFSSEGKPGAFFTFFLVGIFLVFAILITRRIIKLKKTGKIKGSK